MALRNDLKLELWLKHYASASPASFPEREQDYWKRYERIKEQLNATSFRNAAAGLASSGGTLYTQHDLGHVNDVINAAGRLLGCDEAALGSSGVWPVQKLSPYETYALLVAILLHDAGNAAGRMGHERKAFAILSEMQNVCIDSTERRTISRIAQAHGGRTASGDKDTIRLVIAEDPADIQGTPIRPRLLAAVLRMADEISEGPTRANVVALKKPYAQPEAVIHNLYCKIVSIGFDLRARQLTLTYDVDAEHLEEVFADGKGQTRIIDYIAERVAKCDSERQYCNRYYASLLVIEKMIVRLGVTCDDGEQTLFQKTFVFQDEGYPVANAKIAADLPSNAEVLAHCQAGREPAEASA